jgi:hypothetical protein
MLFREERRIAHVAIQGEKKKTKAQLEKVGFNPPSSHGG